MKFDGEAVSEKLLKLWMDYTEQDGEVAITERGRNKKEAKAC